jgi:hypothetical protein
MRRGVDESATKVRGSPARTREDNNVAHTRLLVGVRSVQGPLFAQDPL